MNKEFDIEEELKKLPKSPGVYLMHDAEDTIIYIGKAVNLFNRVHSYFRKTTKSEKIKSSEDIQINHDLLIHNLYVLFFFSLTTDGFSGLGVDFLISRFSG